MCTPPLRIHAVLFCSLTWTSLLPAQEETGIEVQARIEKGGDLFPAKWRRGDDGMLQVEYFADSGLPDQAHFVTLLGDDLREGLQNCGAIGWLSLWFPGDGDLLGMTDAEFHLKCLDIDTSDVGLRQYLALPLPSFAGNRGRAQMLDRMLAIDLLRRRGCTSAAVEMNVLVTKEGVPRELKDRAAAGAAALTGGEPLQRRRLDPLRLRVPKTFAACLVVDHGRLPDLGWLTAAGRRLGMRMVAREMAMAGGAVGPSQLSGAQRMCDVVSELPFGIVLRFGNVRLDQSCVFVVHRQDGDVPVTLGYAAAGAFDAERWAKAKMPDAAQDNNPLWGGKLDVGPDFVQASSGDFAGSVDVERAHEILRDDGAASRIVVPETSVVWDLLGGWHLPRAKGAEFGITFGDPARLVLTVAAGSDDDARAFVTQGKDLLARAEQHARASMQDELGESAELRQLFDALFGATLAADGSRVTAKVEVKGFGRERVIKLLEKVPL